MAERVLKNARVLTEEGSFVLTDLVIREGVILSVGKTEACGEDLQGRYVIPGLVDIHTHGCAGGDHLDGTLEKTQAICRRMAEVGTTTVLATVMTQSRENMLQAVRNAAEYAARRDGARIRGVYLEGPFFCDTYRGAQHPDHLLEPEAAFIAQLQEACGGLVRILSLAPEKEGALSLIPQVAPIRVFLGHTASDYETAKAAFAAGATGLTHAFNGMAPMHHRKPGALGAAMETDGIFCECICDGFHVHPAMVGLLYRQVGRERFCVISDSLRPAGLPDGRYESGGQPVTVKDGKAYLDSGTIAGSTTCLLDEVRNLVSWGICTLADAAYAASTVPAKAAGIFDTVGSITPGKVADLLILEEDLSLREVILGK